MERSVTQTFQQYLDRTLLFVGPQLNPRADSYVEEPLTCAEEEPGRLDSSTWFLARLAAWGSRPLRQAD